MDPTGFSDIAFAKFLQTAPELSSLIMTFKDVSEELTDDSDIQVGIFILRSGEDTLYVPVIGKGEGVYPIDSIFISSKNRFFPLSKNTIEVILASQKMSMGKTKKIPSTVQQNPSVYGLVNPPRTGKFTYASASRMTEFLAVLPNEVKGHVLEKISADSDLYNKLHGMFGLEGIVTALKTKLAPATQPADRSVGAVIMTEGDNLPTPQIISILTRGYAIDGANALTRMAIQSQTAADGKFTNITSLEGGYDYEIVMKNGTSHRGFCPARTAIPQSDISSRISAKSYDQVVLFENGDFAITGDVIAQGDPTDNRFVIKAMFDYRPPVLLKDVNWGDTIAILGDNLRLIGIYRVTGITQTYEGCVVKAENLIDHKSVRINGIRGYTKQAMTDEDEIFVPMTSLVALLNNNISFELEKSVASAVNKKDMLERALLNSSINLTYDNVEFSINGRAMGKEAQVMEFLVAQEGVSPDTAETFIKKAMVDKRVVIYLSKKADFEAGQIPEFGNKPPKQVNPMGTQQDRLPMNKLKPAVDTGDNQTVESMVISELLQSQDMNEYIVEYLPDIEEAIDRLGRILFLGRIHINKLGEGNDSDEVFTFLSQLKNVYKMLGDNYIRLERLAANAKKT